MARLRSGAAPPNHEPEPQTSDDDDGDYEDIPSEPALIPAKRNKPVTLRPQPQKHHARPSPSHPSHPLKRARGNETSPQALQGPSKRQRTGNTALDMRKRNGPPSLVPTFPSRTTPPAANGKQANNKSSDYDCEDDEMVQIVNSMIHPQNAKGRRHSSEGSPSDQLIQEELLRAPSNSSMQGVGTRAKKPSHEPGETDRSNPGVRVAAHGEQDASDQVSNVQLDMDYNEVDHDHDNGDDPGLSSELQQPSVGQHDIYEIPLSPPSTNMGTTGIASRSTLSHRNPHDANGTLEARHSQLNQHPSTLAHSTAPHYHKSYARGIRGHPGESGAGSSIQVNPVESGTTAVNVQEVTPVAKVELRSSGNEAGNPAEDNEVKEESGGGGRDTDADFECIVSGDAISEDDFTQDVADFENRDVPEEEVLPDIFRGLRQDDIMAIHIELEVLHKAMRLMGRKGWTDLRFDWPDIMVDAEMAETQHGQRIIPFLAKLKRLCQAAPRASSLRDQNSFLAEHSKMISYYFSRIQHLIKSILRELCRQRQTQKDAPIQTRDEEEGEEEEDDDMDMAEDIVTFIIPMILQVLTSISQLGGDRTKNDTEFTAFSVKLLTRGVKNFRPLYERAMMQLSKGKPESSSPPSYLKQWEAKQKNRERLRPHLDTLLAQIRWAPGFLAKKHDEEAERQRKLERQKEIKLQLERDRLEKQRRDQEQNRRAFLCIRERMKSWTPPLPSARATASHKAPTLSRPPRPTLDWSREEKEFLFKKLQNAYPKLPDLSGYVRQALDREVDDVRHMARRIMKVILTEAYGPSATPAEVEEETNRMFRIPGNGRRR